METHAGYKYTSSSLAIITSSVSATPPVIEISTPRNHHHFSTTFIPPPFWAWGMEALHLSFPLYSGWFAHLSKHLSPLVCLVELCLLMVFLLAYPSSRLLLR